MILLSILSKIDFSLLLSILALLFSAITYFVHDNKIKRQEKLINDYQIEKIHDEKLQLAKALVKANIYRESSGKSIIKVFNAGKSIARNIRFEILSESDGLYIDTDIFPYEFLNPQESTELVLHATMGSPDKVKIQLLWDDDNKHDNSYEQILTI